jgi:ATP-binding cassette subfamily C protein
LTFEALPKQKTAIVGPSGAGKTTTFEIAAGFRLPSSGTVTISGYTPRDIIENFPGAIGFVPQRPQLISASLAENVSLVEESSTNINQVRNSLELAGLGEFINPIRFGLARFINPDSGELSGGEIQRLGLARALYRDPKILFLDEATSALDAETESKVNQTLDKLRGNMTIVLIAHRLSTVMNADNIIYLDKGRVVAQGTFQELKAKVPDFAKAVELMDLRD